LIVFSLEGSNCSSRFCITKGLYSQENLLLHKKEERKEKEDNTKSR